MKIFAFFLLCLTILFFIVIPGIEEYNKHKDGSKIKALLYSFVPLLCYIGLVVCGFILYEIIPNILENIF